MVIIMTEILKFIYRYSLKAKMGKISLFKMEIEWPFSTAVCWGPGLLIDITQPQARLLQEQACWESRKPPHGHVFCRIVLSRYHWPDTSHPLEGPNRSDANPTASVLSEGRGAFSTCWMEQLRLAPHLPARPGRFGHCQAGM